jgi:ketosteroid isomerase-like protein
MTMTVHEAFVKGREAFKAHDIDGVPSVLAENCLPAPGGSAARQGGVRRVLRGWFGAFPDAHVSARPARGMDVAVEEGTFTGTHRGVLHSPAGDIPPTGQPVAVPYVQVLRFRDGQHASFNLMYDRLLMLEQLGLIPAAA